MGNCMEYVLRKFYQDIVNENYISSENQQLLALCEIWNKIGELLGIGNFGKNTWIKRD